jgi:hypothetical protein
MKPRVIKIPENNINTLEQSLAETLGLENFQLYFPALSLWFNYYNNDSYRRFTLNSEYLLKSLKEPVENEFEDSYIKHMFNGTVVHNKTGEELVTPVFIKMNPVLDVISYLKNDYNLSQWETPNVFNFVTNNKINSYHYTAYIDNLFTYIGSKYDELNLCPTFPKYYGGFIGVTDKYEFDLSEEYEMIQDSNWFTKNLDKLYKMRIVEIETELDEKIVFDDSSLPGSPISGVEEICSDNSDDADGYVENLENVISEDEWETEEEEETPDQDLEHKENKEKEEFSSESDANSIISLNGSFDIDTQINKVYYCQFKRFPVQLVAMEKMEYTLENLVEDLEYSISEEEWFGILFQICFGLSVAHKRNKFVHNDLHCSNIMFTKTENEYLYFKYKSRVYRIPTFGRVTKIIDFGRATFEIDNNLFFSDVFRKNGDAEGQYSFPYNNSMRDCKIKPNPSFDLCRLTKTIIDYVEPEGDVYRLLELWSRDKYGNSLLEHEDDFDLYRIIAKNVKSAVPVKQLEKKVFQKFIVQEDEVPEGEILYKY